MDKCPYSSGKWNCKDKKGHKGKHQIVHPMVRGILYANNASDPDHDGDNDSGINSNEGTEGMGAGGAEDE